MNGHNIVLDVNGGSVHVFDDISYDVLDYYKDLSADEIVEKLAQYPEESVRDSIKEIAELEKANMLFHQMIIFTLKISKKKRTCVKGNVPSRCSRL